MVVTVFLVVFVEDRRLGLGSLLYYIGRIGTSLSDLPNVSTATVTKLRAIAFEARVSNGLTPFRWYG